MNTPIKAYSKSDLSQLVKEAGLPRFRTAQLLDWLYGKHVCTYDEMTNLPKQMRQVLSNEHPLSCAHIDNRQVSQDGTRKYVLSFDDGTVAETVGIPADDGRLTVCCSSQAGCAMGCAFCATGAQGLTRNLLPGEIVDQVLVVQEDFGLRVSNLVVMGQGEPFANYDNTLSALEICNDKKLVGIGARKITVSTCGLIEGIRRFSEEPAQYTLAVSLHSARQEVRDRIMPGLRNQKLEDLWQALARYQEKTGRRITFEYALMKGINDTEQDRKALALFCQGLLCHVNLINLNRVEGSPFKPVASKTTESWELYLQNMGINATVRKSHGSDINGACGQLANAYLRATIPTHPKNAS